MGKTKIEVSRPTKLTTANILSYQTSLNLFMSFSGINFHTGRQKSDIVHSTRLDLFFHPEPRKSTARVPFRGEKWEKLYFSVVKSCLEASCEKATTTIDFYGLKNHRKRVFRSDEALLQCEIASRRKEGSKWLDTHTKAESGNRMGVPLNKSHLLRSSTHFWEQGRSFGIPCERDALLSTLFEKCSDKGSNRNGFSWLSSRTPKYPNR